MIIWDIRRTAVFEAWLRGLADRTAAVIIARRIRRMAMGNLGDARSVRDGISELRVHCEFRRKPAAYSEMKPAGDSEVKPATHSET